ncbi:MAG: GNAT family N-acetyltransferase [Fusobacteriaceae bacterium]
MKIIEISSINRKHVNEFIYSKWLSTDMVLRGKVFDMTTMNGFVMYDNDTIIGLVTYIIENNECEIMSLESIKENQGYGTVLVNKVVDIAIDKKCSKVKLIITNENVNAFAFYQKRGFDIVCVYYDAVKASRKLKNSIPIFGDNNIPIKHELEFEMKL